MVGWRHSQIAYQMAAAETRQLVGLEFAINRTISIDNMPLYLRSGVERVLRWDDFNVDNHREQYGSDAVIKAAQRRVDRIKGRRFFAKDVSGEPAMRLSLEPGYLDAVLSYLPQVKDHLDQNPTGPHPMYNNGEFRDEKRASFGELSDVQIYGEPRTVTDTDGVKATAGFILSGIAGIAYSIGVMTMFANDTDTINALNKLESHSSAQVVEYLHRTEQLDDVVACYKTTFPFSLDPSSTYIENCMEQVSLLETALANTPITPGLVYEIKSAHEFELTKNYKFFEGSAAFGFLMGAFTAFMGFLLGSFALKKEIRVLPQTIDSRKYVESPI